MVWIAKNPEFFTYYHDAKTRGVDLDVVVGDARLKMAGRRTMHMTWSFLDAFTSDAIPIHLFTREAMDMYLRKLAPDGLLVIHISNRYLELEPVLGNLGGSAWRCRSITQLTFAEWGAVQVQVHIWWSWRGRRRRWGRLRPTPLDTR